MKLTFKIIGDTGFAESENYLFEKKDLEYIFAHNKAIEADIARKIERNETFGLSLPDNPRVTFTFWGAGKEQWIFSVTTPPNAEIRLPNAIADVLEGKEPLQINRSIVDEHFSGDRIGDAKVEDSNETTNSIKVAMPTVWITYAWDDNKNGDVDFIAQELEAVGIKVKLDRWNIQAGGRLWEQIEMFIQSEDESDGWILYATPNSLGSEPCKEEYAYALDRALKSRGGSFPVIGLFPGPADSGLIPAGIRSRLYVSTTDPNWKERIKAAIEGRDVSISRPAIAPYQLTHYFERGAHVYEMRPRAGVWYPFAVGIPLGEKEQMGGPFAGSPFLVLPGAPGHPPNPTGGFMTFTDAEGEAEAGGEKWWYNQPQHEATPAKSYYIILMTPPSKLLFGQKNSGLHVVNIDQETGKPIA